MLLNYDPRIKKLKDKMHSDKFKSVKSDDRPKPEPKSKSIGIQAAKV